MTVENRLRWALQNKNRCPLRGSQTIIPDQIVHPSNSPQGAEYYRAPCSASVNSQASSR